MEEEQVIMQLIMNGGNARSLSLKAIQKAEEKDFQEARNLLHQANEAMNLAHEAQTKLIQDEIRNGPVKLSLLMIHAQDHVMNAMTVKDLAGYIVTAKEDLAVLQLENEKERVPK